MKRNLLACCMALSAGGLSAAPPATTPPPAPPAHSSKRGADAKSPSPVKAAAADESSNQTAPKPKTAKSDGSEKSATEVDAEELEFDDPTYIAVFARNVVVVNPEFHMTCDKLTAYLRHKDAKPAAAVSTPAAAPAGGAPPGAVAAGGKAAEAQSKASPLQKAVAEGNVVINQDKTNPDTGVVEHDVAHAKMANYNADTGDVVLSGKPDAQQGGNQVIALDENTTIILNRNRNMTVHGLHKMILHEQEAPAATVPKTGNAR